MKIFSYEEAFVSSLAYFNGDELAAKVFLDKYALRDNLNNLLENTPEMMHRRLAGEFARIEAIKFAKPFSEDQIFGWFDHFRLIIPQGSPMFGIGNKYQLVSLANCFVLPSPFDSYLGIHYTDAQISQIGCRRGGVGWDLSLLRPEFTTTKNAAKTSSGAVEFAKRFSNTVLEIAQNGRRAASLQSILCIHPEIFKFIGIKQDLVTMTGSNITVQFTDEFMRALERREDITLQWPCNEEHAIKLKREVGEVKKVVKAQEVWDKFVDAAWGFGEPGCCFIDRVYRDSPGVPYGYKEVSSNPCGEQYLPPFSSCRLMAINLLTFVKNPYTNNSYFDFEYFEKIVEITQRLADDLIDLEIESIDRIIDKIETDPEPLYIKQIGLDLWKNIKKTALEDRRTGCGYTALADCLAALNLPFISEESFCFAEKIQKTYALSAYRSSVQMAKELGSFPAFKSELDIQSGFIQKIRDADEKLFNDMKSYGRRNMVLLTIAPTGTVSCLTQTSSGLEPVFALSYMRRKKGSESSDTNFKVDFVDKVGNKWQHFEVYHRGLLLWQEINKGKSINESPYYNSVANKLTWVERVEMQSRIQYWVDNSISVTINLPNDVSKETVNQIYFQAWKKGLKGITVYREGCRDGVLVNKKEEKKQDNTCSTPVLKRPKVLDGEIFAVSYKKDKLYVAVGLVDGRPYECFTGINFRHKIESEKGKIVKQARGKYFFITDSGEEYHLTNGHTDDSADALTRVLSAGLRHGCGIEFLVHQLEKSQGDLLSFSKVLARVLKKFIPDGTKVTGENCESCGGSLRREGGCSVCINCGASKCS